MRNKRHLAGAAFAALLAGSVPGGANAQAGSQYIAQISYFGFNFCPRSWASAEGQLLPINTYQALFSILGTTYGGDGRTTFALPDLRGRRNLGQGALLGGSTYLLGARGGLERVTLSVAQIPQHTHQEGLVTPPKKPTSSQAPDADSPLGNTSPTYAAGLSRYKSGPGDQTGMEVDENFTLATTGSSQSHDNLPPYQAVTACIALEGTYPSRN